MIAAVTAYAHQVAYERNGQLVVNGQDAAVPVDPRASQPQLAPGIQGSPVVVVRGSCAKACLVTVDALDGTVRHRRLRLPVACTLVDAGIWRTAYVYTTSGRGCGGLWMQRGPRGRLKRLSRVSGGSAVSTDGRVAAWLRTSGGHTAIEITRLDGKGSFTLSRNVAGGEALTASPVVRFGVVTWVDGNRTAASTATLLLRAKARRGAPCAQAEVAEDVAPFTSVALDGHTTYATQDDALTQLTPSFAVPAGVGPGSEGVGRNC